MADILIKRVGIGVAIASTTDPYSSFEVHRIDRERWRAAPEKPGIYVLYGTLDERPTAYVGISTTNIRSRVALHRLNDAKAWFGVLFAIPLPAAYCQSVEAELIRRGTEAHVVTLVNGAKEARWLDTDDVHVSPVLDAIVEALELLLGTDIFTARDEPDVGQEGAGQSAQRQWSMDEWMAEANRVSGAEYEKGMRDLVAAWMSTGSADRRVGFGGGRIAAALFLVTDAGAHSYWPLAIYPGKVEVPFQWMAYRPATESEGFRRELMQQLNAIDGVDLDESKINGKPSFPSSVLADPATREQVIAVLTWFCESVRRRSAIGE